MASEYLDFITVYSYVIMYWLPCETNEYHGLTVTYLFIATTGTRNYANYATY